MDWTEDVCEPVAGGPTVIAEGIDSPNIRPHLEATLAEKSARYHAISKELSKLEVEKKDLATSIKDALTLLNLRNGYGIEIIEKENSRVDMTQLKLLLAGHIPVSVLSSIFDACTTVSRTEYVARQKGKKSNE